MPAAVADAFTFLHDQIKAAFGTGKKAWFPAARKGATYTVGVECAESPITARSVADMGFATVPQDGLTLHLTAAQMPYEPRPGDLFTIGDTAAGRKYEIIGVAGAEGVHSHYRVVAQRHQ